jgi:dipeptidase E
VPIRRWRRCSPLLITVSLITDYFFLMAGQIVALGGGGFSMEPDNLALDRYILSLWRRSDRDARVCFIPTASADSADYISRFYSAFKKLPCIPTHLALSHPKTVDPLTAVSDNDIFYVGGGNTREMLTIWSQYGLDTALKEAWLAGKILCGISAGAICWFEEAISDSVVEGELHPSRCLGFLPGTACPHYDAPGRREAFHRCLAAGEVGGGHGIDDGAALHFVGVRLTNVVCSRPSALAYRVECVNGDIKDAALRGKLVR